MTSLSQQLRKLAVPQTSALVDLKKRPSILFDPKDAAVKDRKTIFDLGYQGLQELIALKQSFAQFEKTLFQQTTLHVERSIEDSAFNMQLDANIDKFFYHLSPYFMTRSAHMCLEWLIRRFQVHEFNKDSFVRLILPYHETKIFVKCVQIMKLKNPSDTWHWLSLIQKPGVSLTKREIIKRAAKEQFLFSFVCTGVIEATSELESSETGSNLQCLINFYVSVVIGVLESCGQIKEWHISTVLPSIIKGLKSTIVDYISASFMIISQLIIKTKTSTKLLDAFVSQICKVNCEQLQASQVLLLSLIFKTGQLTTFPSKGFVEFISNKWLMTIVSSLHKECISMDYIVFPLVRTTLNIIQQNLPETKMCQTFFDNFLNELKLSDPSAKLFISLILETVLLEKEKYESNDTNVVTNESTNEPWLSNILQLLERQYPNVFDAFIRETMQSNNELFLRNTLCVAFRHKNIDENISSIFQRLYHSNPEIRASSFKEIINEYNEGKIKASEYGILKEALAERIKDDRIEVIQEILKLTTEVLVENVGCASFTESIIDILDKATMYPDTWGKLQPDLLGHLTADIIASNYDNNLLLLVLMRYLIPSYSDEKWNQCIQIILDSSYGKRSPLLHGMAKMFGNKCIKLDDFMKKFLDHIADVNYTIRAEDFVLSVQKSGYNYFKTSINVSHFLIILTAGFKTKNLPETSRRILTFVVNQCKPFTISSFSGKQWRSGKYKSTIPLQLYMDFLQRLIEGTNFNNLLNWESNKSSLVLFLEILGLLTSNLFHLQLEHNEKQQWARYLKDMLNIFFPILSDQINVLSHFFLYENLSIIENYSELRVRSVKVLELLVKGGLNDIHLDLRLILKLVVGLSSTLSSIRQCSLNILHKLQSSIAPEQIRGLVDYILEQSEAVIYDSEQIHFILYSIFNNANNKEKTDELLEEILGVIKESPESIFKSKVLDILKHVKTTKILKAAIPIALNLLDNVNKDNDITLLDKTASTIFEATIMRFDENCIKEVVTNDENAWALIEKSFKMSKTYKLTLNGTLIPISCITVNIFDEPIYNKLPLVYKIKFLKLIIGTISNSDNDVLFLDINKALRRYAIDCKHVLPLLEDMNKICSNETKLKRNSGGGTPAPDIKFLTSNEWKEGVVLLEILESKKKLLNSEILIPILFDILKKCLDVENQSPVEYTKQLILSSILQSCKCLSSQKLIYDVPEKIFRIDLIVQCIRMTQNPETQFKALSLLTHCASLFPQQVLYNSLEIFTFIGSTITRHDDAFSFQVISNVVESIVPILVKSKGTMTLDLVLSVLKVFSDILLDVPEHRRMTLYSKLIHTLGAERYFWLFLCVVFESLTNNEEKKAHVEKNNEQLPNIISSSSEKLPSKVEIASNLLHEFSINICLQTCTSLMSYVKTLPLTKEDAIDTAAEYQKLQYAELFDITAKSAKQLRHFKYLILQFVSTFTSSDYFLKAVSIENDGDNKLTKYLYKNLMIKILSYIPDITDAIEKRKDLSHLKFWRVLLDHCYDTLDNIISLLSPDMFLVVVRGLMEHKIITVRKEVIRLLVNKLQEKGDYFVECSEENISNLLHSLGGLINTILVNNNLNSSNPLSPQYSTSEMIMLQQNGLIATKLLSKFFGIKYIKEFMNMVLLLTNITKKRTRVSKIIFATVVLTLIEVVSNLKANAVSYLPKCMPHLIDALRDQAIILQKHRADNICLVLITGIQKLVETMPLFLGPYVVDIITVLSEIWSIIQKKPSEFEHKKQLVHNLHLIWSKIATDFPARILIPCCESAYYTLMKVQSFSSVGFVMKLLLECLLNLKSSDLLSIQSELTNFFMKSLEFRSQVDEFEEISIHPDDVSKIEMKIIDAFVAWVLKLSESSFRPIYKKMYNWAIRSNAPKGRVLTYFILNNRISDSLKSIFVLFAGDLVLDAAHFLNACNTSKDNDLFFLECEILNLGLLKNILCTLTNIFMYGGKGFINTHRYDSLMPSIVDQLENNLIHNNDELQNILSNCIGQLAIAVSNYVLWKSLNYHILLKTRSEKVQIRIIAFNCCVELARTLGDDFTSLLPETIPFIAELFEDENPQVVKNSRKAVQEIESIVGEPLQNYL